MTCLRATTIIDAGPFADLPRAEKDTAMKHATECATCGPALVASRELAADLKALSHQGPSPDLTAAVLLRINRVGASAAAPTVTFHDAPLRLRAAGAWAATALCAGLALAATALVVDDAGFVSVLLRTRVVAAGSAGLPSTVTGTFVLVCALVGYTIGLLLPTLGREHAGDR